MLAYPFNHQSYVCLWSYAYDLSACEHIYMNERYVYIVCA